jgi:hypothetical protein
MEESRAWVLPGFQHLSTGKPAETFLFGLPHMAQVSSHLQLSSFREATAHFPISREVKINPLS